MKTRFVFVEDAGASDLLSGDRFQLGVLRGRPRGT
jgi:alkanesulfonate monooxygenase SsuD/methylene tetrahydromethanopterin reductase-like flavin-dependent oxidoreductase (luciferase family)